MPYTSSCSTTVCARILALDFAPRNVLLFAGKAATTRSGITGTNRKTRRALDATLHHFSRYEPTLQSSSRGPVDAHGDYYMHLVDLTPYSEAQWTLR